jgi:pre-mRNA-splicing factor ATP-dependent RNA helicase DHX15/PRP43
LPQRILYESAILLNGGQNYLRTVTSIRPEWLIEMAPKYYEHARTVCPELNLQISSSLVNDAITKEIAKLVKFGVTI